MRDSKSNVQKCLQASTSGADYPSLPTPEVQEEDALHQALNYQEAQQEGPQRGDTEPTKQVSLTKEQRQMKTLLGWSLSRVRREEEEKHKKKEEEEEEAEQTKKKRKRRSRSRRKEPFDYEKPEFQGSMEDQKRHKNTVTAKRNRDRKKEEAEGMRRQIQESDALLRAKDLALEAVLRMVNRHGLERELEGLVVGTASDDDDGGGGGGRGGERGGAGGGGEGGTAKKRRTSSSSSSSSRNDDTKREKNKGIRNRPDLVKNSRRSSGVRHNV